MAIAFGAKDYQGPGQQENTVGAPKEIGILDRVNGLSGGLYHLRLRLEGFGEKIHNKPQKGEEPAVSPPLGIRDVLQNAEVELRSCLNLIDDLHSQF